MNEIIDVQGEEAKRIALQFLGQTVMGEIKKLDRDIISKNSTLQGLTLDPHRVLNSIPIENRPAPQQSQFPLQLTQLPPQTAPTQAYLPLETKEPVVNSTGSSIPKDQQLEFSFEESPVSEKILDLLTKIDLRLSKIESSLESKVKTKKQSTNW